MRTLDIDRAQAVADRRAGMSLTDDVKKYHVSRATVCRLMNESGGLDRPSMSQLGNEERVFPPIEKVVLLLPRKVLPQYRAEILQAARANKLPTRAEPGVEAYYQTAKDDPNTLVFFVVFASQDAHDFHMRQDYAKRTFAAFEGKLAAETVYTNLFDLN